MSYEEIVVGQQNHKNIVFCGFWTLYWRFVLFFWGTFKMAEINISSISGHAVAQLCTLSGCSCPHGHLSAGHADQNLPPRRRKRGRLRPLWQGGRVSSRSLLTHGITWLGLFNLIFHRRQNPKMMLGQVKEFPFCRSVSCFAKELLICENFCKSCASTIHIGCLDPPLDKAPSTNSQALSW